MLEHVEKKAKVIFKVLEVAELSKEYKKVDQWDIETFRMIRDLMKEIVSEIDAVQPSLLDVDDCCDVDIIIQKVLDLSISTSEQTILLSAKKEDIVLREATLDKE